MKILIAILITYLYLKEQNEGEHPYHDDGAWNDYHN